MIDVAEFLLARFADDEAVAKYCRQSDWQYSDGLEFASRESQRRFGGKSTVVAHESVHGTALTISSSSGGSDTADMQHIARWDPARVLADCDAKRRVVEYCSALIPMDDRNANGTHGITVLLMMAQPYADHPDFREEWKL